MLCVNASHSTYEGRSINKLQSGIRFVGNLILNIFCEFHPDDVNVTSWTINMETSPLKVSAKNSGLSFVFSGQKDLTLMPFSLEMHPVYGDKCFTRPM